MQKGGVLGTSLPDSVASEVLPHRRCSPLPKALHFLLAAHSLGRSPPLMLMVGAESPLQGRWGMGQREGALVHSAPRASQCLAEPQK